MQKDTPDVFSGTVEVGETYMGGQWKNKRLSERKAGNKPSLETKKTPVLGILCSGDKVWAQIVPDVEAKTLLPLMYRVITIDAIALIPKRNNCLDNLKNYASRGSIAALPNIYISVTLLESILKLITIGTITGKYGAHGWQYHSTFDGQLSTDIFITIEITSS